MNTYGDLLEKILPMALSSAMKDDVMFRKSLPIDYMAFMGEANSRNNSAESRRKEFTSIIQKLFAKLSNHLSIDAGKEKI